MKWLHRFYEKMMKKHIEQTSRTAQKSNTSAQIFGVPIQIIHPLVNDINLRDVALSVKQHLPHYRFAFSKLDGIYVGNFPILQDRNINALYHEGAMWLTNKQSSIFDMVEDIVHEMSHLLEEHFEQDIYLDQTIEEEYLAKKHAVLEELLQTRETSLMLEDMDLDQMTDEEIYAIVKHAEGETEFDPVFDELLYSEFEWEDLKRASMGHFVTPYALVSLSEYFATGFEWFYLKDRSALRKISPMLHNKLEQIDHVVR